MNQKELQQLTAWVRTVLQQWDPIGVSRFRNDEYDSYAPAIAARLVAGTDSRGLSRCLSQIESNAMGLTGNRERCDEFGSRLCDGFVAKSYR